MQPECLFSDNATTWAAARKAILADCMKPFSWQQTSIQQYEPISYGFLHEATIIISYRFPFEATGSQQ